MGGTSTNHDEPAEAQVIDIACANCAKSKTKCDRRHPCGRCHAKGLTCVPRMPHRVKVAKRSGFTGITAMSIPAATGQGSSQTVPNAQSISTTSPRIHGGLQGNGISSSTIPQTVPVASLLNQKSNMSDSARQPFLKLLSQTAGDTYPSFTERAIGVSDAAFLDGSRARASRSPRPSPQPQNSHSDLGVWESTDHFQSDGFARDTNTIDINALRPAPMDIDAWNTSIFSMPMPLNEAQSSTTPPQQNDNIDIPQSVTSDAGGFQTQCISASSGPSSGDDDATWAIDWEHWIICKCTRPPQYPAPDRQKLVLANLDHNFLSAGPWTSIVEDWRLKNFIPRELFTNVTLSDTTREWLLVITQRYMRLAVDVHGLTLDPPSLVSGDGQDSWLLGGYVRLPPSNALHNYLEIVLRNFEPFYPLLPARMLEANHLTSLALGRGPSLLLCFMIAFGSMIDPAVKARRFSTAITEICRHSMHDAMERDSRDLRNPLLYYSALMFIVKGAFSGDKTHMNVCIAHRQLYLMSMRQAGIFKKRASELPRAPPVESLQQAWKAWIERESLSRLAYGWILVEQEISLFYGVQPRINISELEATLPADDNLWISWNADEWSSALCSGLPEADWHTIVSEQDDKSLKDLFQLLIDDQLDNSYQPQLLHIRLLLYPLHVLVAELSQVMEDGFDSTGSRPFSSPTTQASSMLRVEEILHLSRQWMKLYQRLRGEGERFRAMATATLVLFHCTILNVYTSFYELERFARDASPPARMNSLERWIRVPQTTLVHCGQILRLIREMRDELRPVWAAAAAYRATLILWCFSISKTYRKKSRPDPTSSEVKQIDLSSGSMDDDNIKEYLRYGKGQPFFQGKNGARVTLETPKALLTMGMDTIDHGPLTTGFSFGVKQRLHVLLHAWERQQQM